MDLRKVKALIDLVEKSGISELEITEGEERVRISRVRCPVVRLAKGDDNPPSRGAIGGGGGEIRTHGKVAPSRVFKTRALNRSATPPSARAGDTLKPGRAPAS